MRWHMRWVIRAAWRTMVRPRLLEWLSTRALVLPRETRVAIATLCGVEVAVVEAVEQRVREQILQAIRELEI